MVHLLLKHSLSWEYERGTWIINRFNSKHFVPVWLWYFWSPNPSQGISSEVGSLAIIVSGLIQVNTPVHHLSNILITIGVPLLDGRFDKGKREASLIILLSFLNSQRALFQLPKESRVHGSLVKDKKLVFSQETQQSGQYVYFKSPGLIPASHPVPRLSQLAVGLSSLKPKIPSWHKS